MIKEWLKGLARIYLPVYRFEAGRMTVIYAGYSPIKRNYYIRILRCGESKQTGLGRRWFWQIPGLLKTQKPDLVISEISRMTLNRFQKYEGFILPEWAKMRINIDQPMDEIKRRFGTQLRDVAKKIRHNKLTYEILTSKENLEYFNTRFYLPYINKRHKDEAIIMDLNSIWKSISRPFLLAISDNGVMVGAAICKECSDSYDLLAMGLLDGNDEYRRHGVIGAMYYFAIIEGQKKGFKFIDVGGSHPFLTDGLTKYKMGLGAEFVTDDSSWDHGHGHWLGVNSSSSAGMDFIRNNAFIFLNKDRRVSYPVQPLP